MDPPTILERLSSLLSAARKDKLDSLLKRKISALSQISVKSSISEFVAAKAEALESQYDHEETQRRYLEDALHDDRITREQFNEIEPGLRSRKELNNVQAELRDLRKQRKLIEDDLEEIEPEKDDLEGAYIELMITRMESATAKAPKIGSKLNRHSFRNDVFRHYDGRRYNEEAGQEEHFCSITGWYGAIGEKRVSPVKAAHIVPRSLSGDDLDYLFGVSSGGSAIVAKPDNALLLHGNIKNALDNCEVVIYPDLQNGVTQWRLFVTDPKKLTQSVTETLKWKDIHQKELKFLNHKRPAKRFLYFRFIMTCLIQKREKNNVAWAAQLPSKGYLWATPGPYLRKTLLLSLARRVSYSYLPEAFYEPNTFPDLPYCENRPSNEKDYTTTLAEKLISHSEEAANRNGGKSKSESDSETETI